MVFETSLTRERVDIFEDFGIPRLRVGLVLKCFAIPNL